MVQRCLPSKFETPETFATHKGRCHSDGILETLEYIHFQMGCDKYFFINNSIH